MTLKVFPPTTENDYGAVCIPPKQDGGGGGGGGTVTSITATAPIVVTPSPITATGVVSANVMVASGGSHASGVTPDTPATAGTVKFLREDATWADPGTLSSSVTVQAILGKVRWGLIQGINGGGLSTNIAPGGTWINGAGASTTSQNNTFTTGWGSIGKTLAVSAAAAGSAIDWHTANNSDIGWTSSVSWAGGFLIIIRGGIHTHTATMRSFFGVTGVTATPANADPSTLTTCMGIGSDSADTNLQAMCNDGAGTCTKVDLGVNFPARSSQTDIYEMVFYAAPGQASSCSWQIRHMITGNTNAGTFTTNIPPDPSLFSAHIWLNNGTTASAVTYGHIEGFFQCNQ